MGSWTYRQYTEDSTTTRQLSFLSYFTEMTLNYSSIIQEAIVATLDKHLLNEWTNEKMKQEGAVGHLSGKYYGLVALETCREFLVKLTLEFPNFADDVGNNSSLVTLGKSIHWLGLKESFKGLGNHAWSVKGEI